MGIEVTDVCMDKEADCVIVYSNGVSHDSDHETIPNHHDVAGPFEHFDGDPQLQSLVESTEVKEYEVKECTSETSIEVEKGKEEQNVVSSMPEAGLPAEKTKPEDVKTKENNKSHLVVKHASKATAGNVRTKHTIPQPFSLATEKRASNGTRPTAAELKSVNKSSNTNSLRHLNSKKQNQVASATESRFPIFFPVKVNLECCKKVNVIVSIVSSLNYKKKLSLGWNVILYLEIIILKFRMRNFLS